MAEKEVREFEGEFWLPENPERRVPGTLTVDLEEGFAVKLTDLLVAMEEPANLFGPGLDYEIVCCDTNDGKQICLTDCFSGPRTTPLIGQGRSLETVIANRVIVGSHEPDPEVVGMILTTPNLVDFMDTRVRPFAVEGFGGDGDLKIEWSDPGTAQSVEIDGIRVGLEPRYAASVGKHRAEIQNDAIIQTVSDAARPISEHEELCVGLQLFVEFLSQMPTQRNALTATTPDDGRIEIFVRQLDAHGGRNRQWLARREIADRFDAVVPRWFELSEWDEMLYGALRDLVLGGGSSTDRALWAIRFVERYQNLKHGDKEDPEARERSRRARDEVLADVREEHREWVRGALVISGRPSFRQHYEAVLDSFGELFDPLLGNVENENRQERIDAFTKTARDTRNLLAHLTSDGPDTLTEGIDQYYLYERLWLIGRACVLDYLGFSEEEVRHFITSDPKFVNVARQPLTIEAAEPDPA